MEESNPIIERLQSGSKSYACGGFLQSLDELHRQVIFTELYFNRLQRKHDYIIDTLHRYNNDWGQTIYHMLLRSMDVGKNRKNYERLSDLLPLKVIQRECISQQVVESLLIGVSGLWHLFREDSYIQKLKEQFHFLAHKYELGALSLKQWDLVRVPPRKHPILRLSQVARLIALERLNIDFICNCRSIEDIEQLFHIEANNYWSDALMTHISHFTPPQYIGYDKSHLLGINFIIPLQLAYADYTCNDSLRSSALNLLESIKAENNHYIRSWASYGVRVKNALESQALIQLATEFCDKRRCAECPVGGAMVKKIKSEK